MNTTNTPVSSTLSLRTIGTLHPDGNLAHLIPGNQAINLQNHITITLTPGSDRFEFPGNRPLDAFPSVGTEIVCFKIDLPWRPLKSRNTCCWLTLEEYLEAGGSVDDIDAPVLKDQGEHPADETPFNPFPSDITFSAVVGHGENGTVILQGQYVINMAFAATFVRKEDSVEFTLTTPIIGKPAVGTKVVFWNCHCRIARGEHRYWGFADQYLACGGTLQDLDEPRRVPGEDIVREITLTQIGRALPEISREIAPRSSALRIEESEPVSSSLAAPDFQPQQRPVRKEYPTYNARHEVAPKPQSKTTKETQHREMRNTRTTTHYLCFFGLALPIWKTVAEV